MKTLIFALVIVPIGIVMSLLVALLAGVGSFFYALIGYWNGVYTNYWKKSEPKPQEIDEDIWARHIKNLEEKNKQN